MSRIPTAYFRNLFLIVAAYFVAVHLGLSLAVGNKSITAFWPPAGIAVGILLVLGLRYWPAIALGAFLGNLTTHAGVDASLGLAVGNTLEAVAIVAILRLVDFRNALDRQQDIFYLLFATLIGCTIAATIGNLSLYWWGSLAHLSATEWRVYWLGDVAGVLIFAPFVVFVLYGSRRTQLWFTTLVAVLSMVLAGLVITGDTSLLFEQCTFALLALGGLSITADPEGF